jgi:hypothetical protein
MFEIMRRHFWRTPVIKRLLLLAFALMIPPVLAQQSFSCSFGKRAACLGFDDKVVDQNAVCFSGQACGYKGFVCKSKLDDLADEYESLVQSHNELIRRNKTLVELAEAAVRQNRSLTNDYNELIAKADALTNSYEEQREENRLLSIKYERLLTMQRDAGDAGNDSSKRKRK